MKTRMYLPGQHILVPDKTDPDAPLVRATVVTSDTRTTYYVLHTGGKGWNYTRRIRPNHQENP